MPETGVAVVLTALALEYQAVIEQLAGPLTEYEDRGTLYEMGEFAGERGTWQVAFAQTGPGNTGAAAAVERAISIFQPQLVLFVGVAGGRPDYVDFGDVVAANAIYDYESGQDQDTAFLSRAKTQVPAHRIVQRAQAVARAGEWHQRLAGRCCAGLPAAHVRPIAAGGKVVTHHRSRTARLLAQHCDDAAAVEMEGYGFLHGAYLNAAVEAMVVRGISDLLTGKDTASDRTWQPIAARHAAAFAFEILRRHPPRPGRDIRGHDVPRLSGTVEVGSVAAEAVAVEVSSVTAGRLVGKVTARDVLPGGRVVGVLAGAVGEPGGPRGQASVGGQRDPDPHAEIVGRYLRSTPYVERRWLAELVDRHLADRDCRHILLTADAGMGKSSFVAWLASTLTLAPRYFIRVDSVVPMCTGDATELLLSVGRQLARLRPDCVSGAGLRIEVDQQDGRIAPGAVSIGVEAKRVFANPFGRTDITVRQAADDVAGQQIGVRTEELVENEWLLDPAVLQQLALFEPAARLAEREPNAQVVLLIDGLDELRHGPAARGWTVLDWLAQCPRLPDNVRIVATSRHDEDLLQEYRIRQRERLRELRVTSTSSQVAEDLCDYARRLATDTTLSRPLAEVGFALSEVAHAAAKRAAGNFLYLVSWARGLAHAVASGRTDDLLAIAELNSLPAGLDELYGLFVLLVHKNAGADWVAIHRPVLEVLAVARGPLSVPQIALLAGIPEAEPHVKCALADMPQLLHTDNGRSRFFHASLADYLTTPELPNRRPQDFVEAPMVHRQLAARILETYGQRWETCTDDYATANVAHHLVSALRGDQPDDQHRWCATALVELLADSAFVRRLTTVVGVVRVLAEFADAHGALRARFAAAADQIARALAVHCVLMVSGGRLTADVLQAGLGYRRDFTEFLDRVLEHTADSSFVDETVSTMDRPGLESGAVWADFATVQASRFRRRNDFVRADRLLDRIVDWGDQAKALYERGYLYHLTGRVDEAIRCLGRASDLSRQAGHESGAWIGALVRDQIAFLADRLDAETYRDTLLAGLEFFVGASQNGSPHARRWIMNVHYKLLNRASLLQDPHSARDAWHALRDDDWARIERPDLLLVWEGRMALTCGEWQRAVDRYTQLLGPDALVAAPPDQEFIAWYLLEFGRSLAATGRTSEATLAWQQVLRCPDTTAAWPWKPRARALLSGHSGQ